jgi:hypothetical protein
MGPQEIAKEVASGYRLEQPAACPDALFVTVASFLLNN